MCGSERRGRELWVFIPGEELDHLWIPICWDELLDKAGRTGNGQLANVGNVGLICEYSCQDSNTAQPPVTRCSEITVATVWKSMVCRLLYFDNREFFEGWNKCVSVAYAKGGIGIVES